MKKVLSIILASVMLLSVVAGFAACSKTESKENETTSDAATEVVADIEAIQKAGKMVIGITDYAPMNYKDSNGEWTGFDTEYAQAVAEKLGVEAEFIVINWDTKFTELKAGSIDCIWNGMTITDEVKLNSDITNPYVENAQVVVTNPEVAKTYTKLSEMTSLSFVAESGSAGEAELKNSGLEYVAVGDQAKALMEVASGSADACVIDITMANAMTGEGTSYSDLAQVETLNEELYGIACRQGSDLTAKIDEITSQLIEDGTMSRLAEKYSLTLAK